MNTNYTRRSNKLMSPDALPFDTQTPAFNELLAEFLTDCKQRNLSRRTIAFYEYSLLHIYKSFKTLDQIFDPLTVTTAELQNHIVGRLIEKRLAPHTINGRIKSCKAFFAFLSKRNFIADNVADKLEIREQHKRFSPLKHIELTER